MDTARMLNQANQTLQALAHWPLLQTNSSEQSLSEEQEAPRKITRQRCLNISHEKHILPAQCPAHEQDPPPLLEEPEAHFPLLQTSASEQSLLEEQELPVISISPKKR